MCGGPDEVQAPPPTAEEKELMRQQSEMISLQNQLLKEQMSEVAKARETMEDYYEIYDKETMKDLLTTELEMSQKSLSMMNEYLDREPTELEKRWEDISLLQAERQEKALRGELPVSEGTMQRYEEEKEALQERLSRKVGRDWEESTPGIQAMDEFESRWSALMDAERRAEIDRGSAMMLSTMGYTSEIAQQRGWVAPGTVANPASAFGRGMSLLESKSSYGYGASLSGLQGAGSSIAQAYQPYQFQRGMEFDAARFNAEMAQKQQAGMMQLVGTVAGGAMAKIPMSDKRTKERVLPISDALRKVLALKGYSWKYKPEYDEHNELGRRFGVMAQDLEEVEPDMVYTDPDTGIKYVKADFHGLFVEAFKELAERVQRLEERK